jgi:hypothetical protein
MNSFRNIDKTFSYASKDSSSSFDSKVTINHYVRDLEKEREDHEEMRSNKILVPNKIIIDEKERNQYDTEQKNHEKKKKNIYCFLHCFYKKEKENPDLLVQKIAIKEHEMKEGCVKKILIQKKNTLRYETKWNYGVQQNHSSNEMIFFDEKIIKINIPPGIKDIAYLLFYNQGNIVNNKKYDLKVIVQKEKEVMNSLI